MTVLTSVLVKYISRVILYSGCLNSVEGGRILAFEDLNSSDVKIFYEIKLRLVKR